MSKDLVKLIMGYVERDAINEDRKKWLVLNTAFYNIDRIIRIYKSTHQYGIGKCVVIEFPKMDSYASCSSHIKLNPNTKEHILIAEKIKKYYPGAAEVFDGMFD